MVDRQRADRDVSFCAPDVKQISPTAFSSTAKDFTPEKDRKILIVGRQ